MNWKSRKLLILLSLLVISSTMVFAGHGDFSTWQEFAKWLFGIYATGNVGEHIANNIKARG
tara:strand:+ start:466 stop:648 length:183 start_codon:yes stop_codon:yes gene_type:complete